MKLPSAYEPSNYEANIYKLWEKGRVFQANPTSDKPRFSISMPPPNETGTLHVGHAIGVTLQDVMARRARQTGYDVLWLPGTDHAALAVNAIIEKKLAEQGTSKQAVGREEFLIRTRDFVGNSRDTMIGQIKAMGASADWSRLRYTLDEALNRCVNEVFVKMFNDGLIYRGNRIVNWDPNLQTNVSDDEVEHKEEIAPFYTFQYGPFQIGTARPETKFGDKYVVMHPDDERYKQFKHGDQFEAEWINGKVTATVIKDQAVDPNFGTGVMTITPWHDHTDFEIAERHGLEKDQIIDFGGRLLPIAEEFAGMSITEARPKIVEKLKAKGLLVKIDDNYVHNIAINERGKGVIEPQIRLQWFIDVNRPVVEWKGQKRSLKEVMRSVIDDQDIQIVPERFNKVYFHWIDNLRDWCISRQIWWGHRIPVWYRGDEVRAGVLPPDGEGWQQDHDTLDTWFSSALWTWSTLIDQEKAKDYSLTLEDLLAQSIDYQKYHPTSVLETGWDILFFWVARMILATTYATGHVPFKTVYLHGLVRTESGKKMSKSDPASIIDPLEIIPQYGADALRLGLISGTAPGADQRLGRGRISDNRNFCNKIWNVARYIEGVVGDNHGTNPESKSLADHWILNKLSNCFTPVKKDLEDYRFADAYDALYHFIWDDLADWYIEASKVEPNRELLAYVLESTLALAHPFAPFLTEAIWQELGWRDSLLAGEQLPELLNFDKAKAEDFEKLKMIISEARRIASIIQVAKPSLNFHEEPIVKNNSELIKRLARLSEVNEGVSGLALVVTGHKVWLDVSDQQAQQYKDRLYAEAETHVEAVKRLQQRLGNKSYVDNAPADLIEQTRQQLVTEQTLTDQLRNEWANL